ncbi:MAG: alpha/beta fold hydrolase, partial [Gemmatimonas sp.]|uniref:alpha/beta fold hydrolase n=1 Tax=Gemmatimonas sp. TaxID=1962908 RepID=UPI00391F0EBB
MTPALPPALVVHGALGSTAQMHPIVEALSASGRFAAVQAVELPGHGRTPTSVGFGMGPFTSALATAVRDVGFGRPVVFGYSMGGYVALLLEASAPGSLGGIVTLGTMLHWTPEVAARARTLHAPAARRPEAPAEGEPLDARLLATTQAQQL